MPENPLLPNRKLRELHARIAHCRALDRRRPHTPAREALLAATSMQLLPGDILSAEQGDRAAYALAPEPASARPTAATPPMPRLALCAAMAAGLQAAAAAEDAHHGLVLAYTGAGVAEPGWASALQWAHKARLPLLLCCADATGGAVAGRKSIEPPLTWPNVTRLARKIKLPVLTVDGEDAVAVYRVMQESVMRAREGGGPAVFWAVLSPQRPERSQSPLTRLEKYMAVRRIALPR